MNGFGNVAQLVEETTLRERTKVDGLEGSTETGAAIVNEECETALTADTGGFQFGEEGSPACRILVVGQGPGQDLGVILVRPDAHRQQDRPFEASFLGPLTSLAVSIDACRG